MLFDFRLLGGMGTKNKEGWRDLHKRVLYMVFLSLVLIGVPGIGAEDVEGMGTETRRVGETYTSESYIWSSGPWC